MYFCFTSSLCLHILIERWGLASAEEGKLPCSLRADVHSSPCPRCIFLLRSPLWAHYNPHLPPLQAPANASHQPHSLTSDLGRSPHLNWAVDPGKEPGTQARGETGSNLLLRFPLPLRHMVAAIRGPLSYMGSRFLIELYFCKLTPNQGPKCFCTSL